MYIGSTGPTGLHHMIWEVVDNSFDEAMAGHASVVTIHLMKDNWVAVEDDGRGIPTDIHPEQKISALELVLTKLHAGGKFGGEASGYKISGGLHGVGVSVVNALSDHLKAEIHRDGQVWKQEFKKGIPQGKAVATGKSKKRGTIIAFHPDATIFETIIFDLDNIINHLRQQAYLTAGIHVEIIDERGDVPEPYGFYFEGGVASYVRHLNERKEIKQPNIFYVKKQSGDLEVEVSLQYTTEYYESVHCYANNIMNPDGGTHLAGFRAALTRVLNSYARDKGYIKEKDTNLTGDDTREGLTAVLSVKLPDPQFEGQTKGKLGNPEARSAVESVFGEALQIFLEEHPRDAEEIIGKCLLSARARAAARAARDTVLRKGVLEGMTLPGKLADCSSKDNKSTELYIVEGDSAGGCFSGHTKVALTDGRNLSFLELEVESTNGKQNYCYTILTNGKVGIAPVTNVRRTKQNAEVVRVTLDDGSEIICTPDHKFMIRNGEYVEAKNLAADVSLMPLRRQQSKIGKRITITDYEMLFDPLEMRWVFTHVLADEYNIRAGIYSKTSNTHRHHIDFNKHNNNPENIISIDKEDHLQLHRTQADKTLRTPEVLEKLRAIRKTDVYRQKISNAMSTPKMHKLLSTRAKKQWDNQEYKTKMMAAWQSYFANNPEYQKMNRERLQKAQQEYWNNENNREAQSQRTSEFFNSHPEQRTDRSNKANEQWLNPALLTWRSEETKKQWTDEFRTNRKQALDHTYVLKALVELYWIRGETGSIDEQKYQEIRLKNNDKSLLKFDTIVNRYFEGSRELLTQAVVNFNHRVKSVESMTQRFDVYDLEVPETHNFALASGVFVHNSAKQGRNREFQAILPLRGKILNVERARLDKLLANNEIKNLVIAMGTNIGEAFDITGMRYGRIIIMTDADVDGAHICTLLLTLFYRHFPALIQGGHIYIAMPPLYRIQIGKQVRYAYSDVERAQAIEEMTGGKASSTKTESVGEDGEVIVGNGVKVNIQRYKGLGEMNPDQLWDTTMNPETRMMKQVSIEDAALADETFDMLMGADVAPRKKFIQTHAKDVTNLDV